MTVSEPISMAELCGLPIQPTRFGYCMLSVPAKPCEFSRDCLNCPRHVFVKGEVGQEERLQQYLVETEQVLNQVRLVLSDEQLAGDAWALQVSRRAKRLRELLLRLSDPAVEDGELVQLDAEPQCLFA